MEGHILPLGTTDQQRGPLSAHEIDDVMAVVEIGPDSLITSVNTRYCAVCTCDEMALLGRHFSALDGARGPDGDFTRAVEQVLCSGAAWRGVLSGQKKGGALFALAATIVPRRNAGGKTEGCVLCGADVTEPFSALEETRRRVTEDPHLGLLTRQGFLQEATRLLSGTGDMATHFAVVVVDIDDFREMSKHYGAETCDSLLRVIALRMMAICGLDAVVGRCGGDEFSLFLKVPEIPSALVLEMARVRSILAKTALVGELAIAFSLSLGYAVAEKATDDVERLLLRAELAVHASKRNGGGCVTRYREAMEEAAQARRKLLAEARQALAASAFAVHYQPFISIADGKVRGCEALVRWRHAERGMLLPGAFSDLFKDFALTAELGRYVREIVVADLAYWRRTAGYRGAVSINIAMADLANPSVADDLADALHASGLSPRDISVEVSETMLLKGNRALQVRQGLESFAERGFRIAFDDFGTGYASLTHLRELPLDVIKVDQSFVREMDANPRDRELALGIVTLARRLNLEVVAEGVETEAQFRLLSEAGCTVAQGFLFSKAVTAAEFPVAVARSEAHFLQLIQKGEG